jgi:hypothetical protein
VDNFFQTFKNKTKLKDFGTLPKTTDSKLKKILVAIKDDKLQTTVISTVPP